MLIAWLNYKIKRCTVDSGNWLYKGELSIVHGGSASYQGQIHITHDERPPYNRAQSIVNGGTTSF